MAAVADDGAKTSRDTAVRRVTSARGETSTDIHKNAARSRTTTQQSTSTRGNTTTKNAVSRDSVLGRTTASRGVTERGNTKSVASRATATANTLQTRNVRTSPSRAAILGASQSAPIAPRTTTGVSRITPSRAATRVGATSGGQTGRSATRTLASKSAGRISRAAAMGAMTADEIMSRDFSKCKTVYHECMDEFCANKDTQLKRCACSARVNEFSGYQAQLDLVEDKLLDFNQRLLTVNMDAEDAAVLGTATEGELAFNAEDKSESKKALDAIAKKLNDAFGDTELSAGLGAISLSLNTDAAFDSIDSLAGVDTTTKTGVALYNAALPICEEMAAEVCSPDDMAIVKSGYLATIEQDCNTVAKSYASMSDAAREKIREGGALLDISRLNIHQDRNSDDILTCKTKMINMLTDTTVCGENLGKCLDMTGRYIDPSTGEAFLSVDLVKLDTLLTRPSASGSWTSEPANASFISYLETKKEFLEPAMAHCQDISDAVWDDFIEDALAQIKLAQTAKMEEVRQSCTTLLTQCLDTSLDSLNEFDSRALSTFGVWADKTANDMCAEIKTSCTALINVDTDSDTPTSDWYDGVQQVQTDITYNKIIETCREVGRACIVQTCKSIDSNFGLCLDIGTSVNRNAILSYKECWDEVNKCVANAGADALGRMFTDIDVLRSELNPSSSSSITYAYNMYSGIQNKTYTCNTATTQSTDNAMANCIYDPCQNECAAAGQYKNETSCIQCRIAERIWGNCQADPSSKTYAEGTQNSILLPADDTTDTLLSWFAKNTGTDTDKNNCRTTKCGPGEVDFAGICQLSANVSTPSSCDNGWWLYITPTWRMCCTGYRDAMGNCVGDGKTENGTKKYDYKPVRQIKGLRTNVNKSYFTDNDKATSYDIIPFSEMIAATTGNDETCTTDECTPVGLALPSATSGDTTGDSDKYTFVAFIKKATDVTNGIGLNPDKTYALLCEGKIVQNDVQNDGQTETEIQCCKKNFSGTNCTLVKNNQNVGKFILVNLDEGGKYVYPSDTTAVNTHTLTYYDTPNTTNQYTYNPQQASWSTNDDTSDPPPAKLNADTKAQIQKPTT